MEYAGFFFQGYSTALAMAALKAPVKSFDVDVTVVADHFSNHKKYHSDEVVGKRLLVVADKAPRPFEIMLPLANDDGEKLTFESCNLKMLARAHVKGLEAYVDLENIRVAFRAKGIEGVK